MFAPVYRQATLTSLISRMSAARRPTGGEVVNPYDDVLDAFRTYMADDNDGRGVVLIGHSQGSGMLTRLIAEEIDPNADVREQLGRRLHRRLVGRRARGRRRSAARSRTSRSARADDQTGCVVSWASFRVHRAAARRARFFGRPRSDGEGVAGVRQPGGARRRLRRAAQLLPGRPATRSILDSLGTDAQGPGWLDPPAEITTPFVSAPGLVSGECVSDRRLQRALGHREPRPAGPRVDDITGDLAGGGASTSSTSTSSWATSSTSVGSQAEAYAGN